METPTDVKETEKEVVCGERVLKSFPNSVLNEIQCPIYRTSTFRQKGGEGGRGEDPEGIKKKSYLSLEH
ncbi:hypothetical protein TNCV_504891 [Trichonephila clavipes]|nr:hypothetical protein TNCV_504891 [Trichonephila clavipes]